MKVILAQLMVVFLLITITTNKSFSQSINLDESTGCMVSEVRGKVTYTEKGSKTAKTVSAGTVLPEDATVTVANKASFSLACDDRSLPFRTKGTYQMAALAKDVQAKGEQSRFAKMAFAAKGYGTTPPDTTKVRKGWGDKDSLLFIIPIGGKVPLQPTKFSWTPLKAGSIYKLIVYENAKDAPVLSATTSGASFNFDPAQLAVKTGKLYHVQVMLANDGKTASKVVNISFVSPNEGVTALEPLMKDKEYIGSNAVKKSLMEAMELESRQLNSLASERYQKAISLDAKNTLAKQMYVAFLDRVSK